MQHQSISQRVSFFMRGYKLNCVTARFKYEEPAAPQTQS